MNLRARLLWLTGAVIATGAFVAVVPGRRGWFDVRVYYGTVHTWVYHGGHIYDFVMPGTNYGFTYPPFAALCMLPLAVVSADFAIAGMVALNAIAAAAVAYWLVDPIAKRHGWSRWFTLGIAGCAVAALGPVRDTVSFGQINLILLALVWGDLRLLTGRGSRFAGVGIGLAAAIKLTPTLFLCYLLLSRRWPAAMTAAATAVGATVLGVVFAAAPSRVFWTSALWQTDRVGSASYISNQSLMGIVARLNPAQPNRLLWAAATGAVLCAWAYRVRRAGAAGDDRAGFALTAVAACLISPVTWVHHLVWLIPALVLTADWAMLANARRRWTVLGATILAYLLLSSDVVWPWATGPAAAGLSGFLGSNTYVWICLALLLWMPVGHRAPADSTKTEGGVADDAAGVAAGLG